MGNEKAIRAKKLAANISNKVKRFSLWLWKKSKKACLLIKKGVARVLADNRLEREKLAIERGKILTVMDNRYARYLEEKNEALLLLREKEQVLREKEQIRANEERQLRHEILLEELSDDFNTLDHNLDKALKKIDDSRFLRLVLASESALGEHYRALLMNKEEVYAKIQGGITHYISRTVADISDRERGLLKMISYLNLLGIINDDYYDKIQLAIAYNQGTCSFYLGKNGHKPISSDYIIFHFLPFWAKTDVEKPAIIINEAIATIGQVRKTIKDPKLKETIEKEILGAQGWLRTDSLQAPEFSARK